MLINKKHVKEYALEVSKSCRSGKFKRVSNEFLVYIDLRVKEEIARYVKQLPSVGVTIK